MEPYGVFLLNGGVVMSTRISSVLIPFLFVHLYVNPASGNAYHPTMIRIEIDPSSTYVPSGISKSQHLGSLSISANAERELAPPETGLVWTLAHDIQYPPTSFISGSPLCYYYTRKVVATNKGLFVAGWETGDPNNNEIMSTWWDPLFGNWTVPLPVSASPSDAGRLDLTGDIHGNIHSVWHQDRDSLDTYEIYYSKMIADTYQWTDPVMISEPDNIGSNFPTIHVDNSGNVTARWSELTRDSWAGNIIVYHGYRTITSYDWGDTWNPADMEWATEDTLRYIGEGCIDRISGDIYLVDNEFNTDGSDRREDLIVYFYDKAADQWSGPEIPVYGGGAEEPFHGITNASATVGPDGIVHILYAQTQNRFDWGGDLNPDQTGSPTYGQLFHIHGTYGAWSNPKEIYPGSAGIIEGYDTTYPDSTFLQFSGYTQVGTDGENSVYISTRSVEYFNGWFISGNRDMYSDIDGVRFQPEAWIAKLEITPGSEWVWTRASNINLRPDSIGIKYTKLTEHVPASGPGIVWDETYDGYPPTDILFSRLADFTAPGSVSNLEAFRPVENGPITLTWENPEDEDLMGIKIIRSTMGKAHLAGLRRGSVPMNEYGEWLYSPEDIWILEPDSITGEWEKEFYDADPPDGEIYYTLVPFDHCYHHTYPLSDDDYIMVPAIVVTADDYDIIPRELVLERPRPNPVKSETTIRFAIPDYGHVHLAIYDISGRIVRILLEGPMSAGSATIRWNTKDDDGSQLGSGVYFCRIEHIDVTATQSIVVIR